MADQKLSDLTAYSPLIATDYVYGVDQSGPTSKKILASTVKTFVGNGLTITSGTDANTTMAAGNMYVTDMSAWSTADRNYTLPASPTIGDRVGVMVSSGNASYELIIKGNTSQTINGGSAASEWSRVFITGEIVILIYVASNTWIVERDGRIAMKGLILLTTAPSTNEAANTYVYATAASPTAGVWTAQTNVGNVCTVASERITARRACKANVLVYGRPANALTDQKYFNAAAEVNGTTLTISGSTWAPVAATVPAFGGVNAFSMATDDYLRYKYRSEEGSKGLLVSTGLYFCFLSFTEVF